MEKDMLSLIDEMYEGIIETEAIELGIDVEKVGFSITKESQANFFLKRMEEVSKEKAELNEMCDKDIEAHINKVNEFRNKKVAGIDNAINYFTELLEDFAKKELLVSKKKSMKLINGTLQFKKAADKYEYEEEKLIKYMNENNLVGFTRTKVELNKVELKKSVTVVKDEVMLEGKKIEGITVTPGLINFSIKL